MVDKIITKIACQIFVFLLISSPAINMASAGSAIHLSISRTCRRVPTYLVDCLLIRLRSSAASHEATLRTWNIVLEALASGINATAILIAGTQGMPEFVFLGF